MKYCPYNLKIEQVTENTYEYNDDNLNTMHTQSYQKSKTVCHALGKIVVLFMMAIVTIGDERR